ncbi:RNA-directed DNA polymerase, eukaryota, reverse transcriptase zinc-binding domain protein [Tanacetum coccineum]
MKKDTNDKLVEALAQLREQPPTRPPYEETFVPLHIYKLNSSKLDRFLVSDGFLSLFPHTSAVCLDRHLSDHRPILLREFNTDYGATPFRLFHSWFDFQGFDDMITQTWNSINLNDSNAMVRFKKKLQALKKVIRLWIGNYKRNQMNRTTEIKIKLKDIDKLLDQLGANDDLLSVRSELLKQYHDIHSVETPKPTILGVGIPESQVLEAATLIGCSVLHTPFKYLGIMVGENMSSIRAWDETVNKLKMSLSSWKLKTLSIGGRLTLLKSVLGSTPIYNMSLFKVPKAVLKSMESIRRNFFNVDFGAFLSRDQSLWAQVIHALHGSNTSTLSASYSSLWSSIIKECNALKSQGLDLISHCKIRVGNGMSTSFWHDQWLGDSCLRLSYPRLFALENNKVCSVAAKMSAPFVSSLRRDVRGGEESAQLSRISDLLDTVVLSNMGDRRFPGNLNGTGGIRWVKQIPIKVNVLAWKISMDRLPTRVNLHRRGVQVSPISCPICCEALENLDHLLFLVYCDLAKDNARSICNWCGLVWNPVDSYRSLVYHG